RKDGGRTDLKTAIIAVGVLPNYVAARDLNGNNHLDLAVVNRGSDTITILLGNSNGTFQSPIYIGNLGGQGVEAMALGDVNGDGMRIWR
ncbi:MAG TPA: VCBS repeat-containing protein, partial [Blastocatellia bacterium]|nr:VCBS repeat-containing protein [Blastocatellia bacterium]